MYNPTEYEGKQSQISITMRIGDLVASLQSSEEEKMIKRNTFCPGEDGSL
jgi:hypothetical protein